jgi:hypothetical protein
LAWAHASRAEKKIRWRIRIYLTCLLNKCFIRVD